MAAQSEEEWCFGMVTGLRPTLQPTYLVHKTPITLDLLEDCCTLVDAHTREEFGVVSAFTKQILTVFSKEISIQILGDRTTLPGLNMGNSRLRKPGKEVGSLSWELNVILYGPSSRFDLISAFATKCNIYLQHPEHCDRNVPYRNPQCLSPEERCDLMTYDLQSRLNIAYPPATHVVENAIDILLDVRQQKQLPQAATPSALRTPLYTHQRQALTFMMQRETGWAMDGRHMDIWKEEVDNQGRLMYYNSITGQKQMRPPNQFRGGLLIDAPGLGKSLSIIALVATDLDRHDCSGQSSDNISRTLLVVPKSLIQTWKDELQRHLNPSSTIRHCVYYGKGRKALLENLEHYMLVITTYSLVRMDWKASLKDTNPESIHGLHSLTWSRVVLDEAHIAREPSKSFAKSVCALRAERRWAVTGTPISNRLMDLYSLFKFLQCSPFSDLGVFNIHVTQNWKARSDPYSVAKLKNLVNCISIRRPKDTVELPPRQDHIVELDFDDAEWEFYRQTRRSTLNNIDNVGCKTGDITIFNVLKLINRLRLICNHGLKSKTIPDFVATKVKLPWTVQTAQSRFDHLDAVGLAKCSNPQCVQDLSSALSSEMENDHEEEPYIEEGLMVLCSTCHADNSRSASNFLKVCNHFPRKSLGGESPEIFDAEDTFSVSQNQAADDALEYVPTKIKRVVQDLLQTPGDEKSVVFSFWTKTLDVLRPHLWSNDIRCVRLDGTLSATSRTNVLRVFRDNPGIQVLLATISCGGIGLDLTAASRAYILEPQWNPTSEAQALDRIHRLGQKHAVMTTRYVMKGTWEENVIKLQRKKQELADLTLNSGAIDKAELTYGRLRYLKELVG